MNKRFLYCLVFSLFNWMLVPGTAVGQQNSDRLTFIHLQDGLQDQLQKKLDFIVAQEKFPGATLSVVLSDGKTYELASGFSDVEKQKKMKVDDRMFCGSTGKTFVSALILRLVADKKLALDDLASEYFDKTTEEELFERLPNAKAITIRSLLNHTSGLPRYLFQPEYLTDIKANPYRKRSPVEGLEAIVRAKAVHAVGNGWSYSDTNYLVLGLIIEKVTGEKYYERVRREILQPLSLTNTIPATKSKIESLIPGYIGSNNFFGLPKKTVENGKYAMNPVFEWCGGGFVTTSTDLAKWMHALHSGKVLGKAMHERLVTPVDFRSGQTAKAGYGLGSFVWETKNGIYYGHAGIMPGHLTQIEYSQKNGFAIALQTNTDEGLGRKHHQLVQEIAELVALQLKDD